MTRARERELWIASSVKPEGDALWLSRSSAESTKPALRPPDCVRLTCARQLLLFAQSLLHGVSVQVRRLCFVA